MVRFKQLLEVLFLTEEHIIHNACSPGNTYLLTGHFHLINGFAVLIHTTEQCASSSKPVVGSVCLS